MEAGEFNTVTDLAKAVGLAERHVSRQLRLAYLAPGHHEGQSTFDLFCNLLSYLRSSGATFAEGHTTQVGESSFLRFRAPVKSEYFLENPKPLLVLEKIAKADINRG